MKQKFLLVISALVLILTSINGYATETQKVYHYQLKNGLQIYVKPVTRSPVVVSEVWYKVGSSYEPNGITGVSHVLEHMMFQGTKKYPGGDFSKIIAANGGQENAATSYDYTYYYQELAADKLPVSLKLEADRMQNLMLTNKDFDKEIQVVEEERRLRTDNNPQALTYERFNAAAYIANPYHQPIIGYMNDLNNMTVNNVEKWYQEWYAPNNAILVVVGDVKPEQVYELAQKYFGAIPAKKLPVVKPSQDLKPLGERDVIVRVPAKLPWVIMGYQVPSLKTAKDKTDAYALELLSAILDSGNSSRFQRDLVRSQQIASSADASYDMTTRLSGQFILYGTPSQGYDLTQLENAFEKEISKLQQQPVSQAELDRVKNQVIAQRVYAKDSLIYQANEIGSLESVGLSWKVAANYINEIEKITPKQLQAVAKKYFTDNRLTVAELIPLPETESTQQVQPLSAEGVKNVKAK